MERAARELEERKARRMRYQLEEYEEPFWEWEVAPGLCCKYVGMDDFCYDRISETFDACDDDGDVFERNDNVQNQFHESRISDGVLQRNNDEYSDFYCGSRD